MSVLRCPSCGGENGEFRLACASCGARLPDGVVTEPRAEATPVLAPGTRLGRFVVGARIGSGGMGVVFEALDEELDRKVAIKLLRPELAHAGARIRREAQAMAKLAHPNVVVLYDVGDHDGGMFVAMERIDGVTLGAWLAEKPRTPREILAVLLDAGRGLAAAHVAGVVHRDFKPANVLVDREGRARVVDFGLAYEVDDAGTRSVDFGGAATMTQGLVGTPVYMPPEALAGRRGDVRSDQWSFCVVLHEALCGERPFTLGPGHTLTRRPPRDLPLPARARRALARGLNERPADRFAEMPALLAELAHDPWRRRRWLVAGGAAVAIAAASVIAARTVGVSAEDPCAGAADKLRPVWNEARRAAVGAALGEDRSAARVMKTLDDYGARWADYRRETCAATVRKEQSEAALDLRMSCTDRLLHGMDAVVELFVREDPAVEGKGLAATQALEPFAACDDLEELRAGYALPRDPGARALAAQIESKLAGAMAYHRVSDHVASVRLTGEALGLAAVPGFTPLRAQALLLLGAAETRLRPAGAEAHLRDAATAAIATGQNLVLGRTFTELLLLYGSVLGRREEAHVVARWAEAALGRVPAMSVRERSDVHALEGELFTDQGEFDEALLSFARARAIDDQHDRPFGTGIMDAREARVYLNMDQHDEARRRLESALAIMIERRGEVHAPVASVLVNLAVIEMTLEEYEPAADHLQRAVRALTALGLGKSRQIVGALSNLATIACARQDWAEALRLGREAASILEGQLQPDHVAYEVPLSAQGCGLLGLGRAAEAAELLQRSLDLAATDITRSSPEALARTRFVLARALWAARRDPAALKMAGDARTVLAAAGPGYRSLVQAIDDWLAAQNFIAR